MYIHIIIERVLAWNQWKERKIVLQKGKTSGYFKWILLLISVPPKFFDPRTILQRHTSLTDSQRDILSSPPSSRPPGVPEKPSSPLWRLPHHLTSVLPSPSRFLSAHHRRPAVYRRPVADPLQLQFTAATTTGGGRRHSLAGGAAAPLPHGLEKVLRVRQRQVVQRLGPR